MVGLVESWTERREKIVQTVGELLVEKYDEGKNIMIEMVFHFWAEGGEHIGRECEGRRSI